MKPCKTRHAYDDIAGTSALLCFAGDLHRGEDEHPVDTRYLTDAAASGLPQRRPVLVEVDPAVIDHLAVLDIERRTALGAVRARGPRLHGAASLVWHASGTWPAPGDVTVSQ